ncbi:SusC/RagA family TonB-linked outer membrane protein [Phocaeicola plebeius]|uniref:SusC/RagA family TonB-linked outer membrane protein n=1 Tax=Phocaeicola plebeius TaxID=310297 RepID=UPI003F95D1FC
MNTQLNRMLFSRAFVKVSACVVLSAGCLPMATYAESVGAPVVETVLQQKSISGKVVDSKGESIIGANIMEKGTTNGTITDFDGNFNLNVAAKSVLQISYIGYKTQEIPVSQLKKGCVITLKEDTEVMDEVVVIGYGTQRKGDVTSAISSVKAEDFTVGKITDAADLVKGKIAGLSVTNSSGDPTATSSIMLRGITTIMGSVTPLVLVDGVEGSLTTVAPENIESIDVLKDASAAAIYGTRGANGVILITTKTGKRESKARVSYSGYASLSNWFKTADFMDTHDVIYGLTPFEYEGYDTDWLAAVTRKAGFKHNHSLSIEGGSKNSTYSANVTFSDEQGIMRKSDNQNLKMQMDYTQYALNDILKFNVNMLYGRQTYTNNNNAYVYRQAIIRNPSSPIYNEDGSYNENFDKLYYYNPVEIQNEMIGDTRVNWARLTGNITVEPIKGWKTNLMLSTKENITRGETYYSSKYYDQAQQEVNGYASKSEGNSRSNNLELTSNYDFSIGKHHVNVLAGYSYLYTVNDGFSAGNGDFPTEAYLYNNLGLGNYLTNEKAPHASMGSYKNDNTLIGFFGRVSYGYADRYNLMLSVRREGSSKFGDNNKWGTFPSASAGWTISNEKFMQNTKHWLDNLKLRFGFGVTGVIPGDSYKSLYLYNYDAYGDVLSQDGEWIKTLYITQNYNPNLKWETTREFNLGLDWSVLNGRLGGSIDVYDKKTTDLLYDYAVPVPPNLYGWTRANVGEMRNRGIEIMINAIPVQTKDFEWSTTLTLSHNSNKLLSLSNDLYETDNFVEVGGVGEPISVATHCMEVGHRLGDFWGLKSVGVDKDGFVLVEVKDDNGNWTVKPFNTNLNVESNRQRLGNGLPKVYAGWNHTFRYKGFDLSLQFTGQFGYQILNAQRSFYENNSIAYNRLKSAANYYPAINTDGTPVIDEATGEQKMVRLSNSMSQGIWSDHIENGDFVKLSSATLGYTVPLKGNIRKYINNLRVYVSGQNLFCITGYSGLDPEVDNAFMSPGIDYQDKYPTTRSFTFGLNVNF